MRFVYHKPKLLVIGFNIQKNIILTTKKEESLSFFL